MGKKSGKVVAISLPGFLATAILFGTATPATAYSLKMSARSLAFIPGDPVQVDVTVQGLETLLGKYPREFSVTPQSGTNVTASLDDDVVRWDIKTPSAELTLPLTVTLPNIPGKKFSFLFTGITPDGTAVTRSFAIWTSKGTPASVARAPLPVAAVAPASVSANSGLFGKTRVQFGATWLHEFEPYKDGGISLGYPRSYMNLDGSLMTQIAGSNYDFGVAGGMYRSPSLISKNPELLASFGRNVWRGGPVLRFRSNKNGNTVLETMVGVNTGDQIQGTNFFSLSSKWEQKIGNPLFKQLGIGSVFPKRYALQNTIRGTLNGALESWSIQEQLDVPLPVFDAKGEVSPLALSGGVVWNAIWDKAGKFPVQFRSSTDVFPWVGVTYRFGPNNRSDITIAGAKGGSYKGGSETPIGLLTAGTLVLEGGDRGIANVDMSTFDEEE